jgi:predicted SprT family Zn-dependent metalloprotease
MIRKKRRDYSLIKTETAVANDTKKYLRKMGYNHPVSIRFSRRLNTTSAEVLPQMGKFTYNRDYIDLNKKKPSVLRNLVIHESAHMVTGRSDNDPVFIRKYQQFSGNKDPQAMRGEVMEPPRYAYRCTHCNRMWFMMRRPEKPGYCSYCGHRLALKSFSRNPYLKKNWQSITENENVIPKYMRRRL